VEAYLTLDEQQQRDYERLLQTEPYQEIGPMMQTTLPVGAVACLSGAPAS
jgi:hypothetical protein